MKIKLSLTSKQAEDLVVAIDRGDLSEFGSLKLELAGPPAARRKRPVTQSRGDSSKVRLLPRNIKRPLSIAFIDHKNNPMKAEFDEILAELRSVASSGSNREYDVSVYEIDQLISDHLRLGRQIVDVVFFVFDADQKVELPPQFGLALKTLKKANTPSAFVLKLTAGNAENSEVKRTKAFEDAVSPYNDYIVDRPTSVEFETIDEALMKALMSMFSHYAAYYGIKK